MFCFHLTLKHFGGLNSHLFELLSKNSFSKKFSNRLYLSMLHLIQIGQRLIKLSKYVTQNVKRSRMKVGLKAKKGILKNVITILLLLAKSNHVKFIYKSNVVKQSRCKRLRYIKDIEFNLIFFQQHSAVSLIANYWIVENDGYFEIANC